MLYLKEREEEWLCNVRFLCAPTIGKKGNKVPTGEEKRREGAI